MSLNFKYDGKEWMGNRGFTEAVLMMWLDRQVSEAEVKLTEAMWVAILDHEGSPSAMAASKKAAAGGSLSAVVAAGVETIGPAHGGAIRYLGEILQQRVDRQVKEIVKEYLDKGKRLPGFGHRIYKNEDLRAQQLIKYASDLGISGEAVEKVLEIEKELEVQKGKKLPVNIDGAMAGVLTDMKVNFRKMNGFFILPRVAGLIRRGS